MPHRDMTMGLTPVLRFRAKAPRTLLDVGMSLQNVKLDKRSACLHTGMQMTAPATARTTSIALTRVPSLALGLILLTVILILPL